MNSNHYTNNSIIEEEKDDEDLSLQDLSETTSMHKPTVLEISSNQFNFKRELEL